MKRVYFAHPVSDYDTPWEASALDAIVKAMPDSIVVNPNTPEHDVAYRERGMSHFIEVCEGCDAIVAAPFPDGNFGAGVGREALSFLMRQAPDLSD